MNEWISVKDRLPEPEVEVIVLVKQNYLNSNKAYKVMATAMYENGNISTDDSMWNWYDWNWYDLDFNYDEENGLYLILKGGRNTGTTIQTVCTTIPLTALLPTGCRCQRRRKMKHEGYIPLPRL